MSPRMHKEDTQRVLTQNLLSNHVNRFCLDQGEDGVSDHSQDLSWRAVRIHHITLIAGFNSTTLLHRLLD